MIIPFIPYFSTFRQIQVIDITFIKNLIHTESTPLQYRPEIFISYSISQMLSKPPHNLNPVPRINNHLFNQLLFHIFGQLILFQKCHSLFCFPLRTVLHTFFCFPRLLKSVNADLKL